MLRNEVSNYSTRYWSLEIAITCRTYSRLWDTTFADWMSTRDKNLWFIKLFETFETLDIQICWVDTCFELVDQISHCLLFELCNPHLIFQRVHAPKSVIYHLNLTVKVISWFFHVCNFFMCFQNGLLLLFDLVFQNFVLFHKFGHSSRTFFQLSLSCLSCSPIIVAFLFSIFLESHCFSFFFNKPFHLLTHFLFLFGQMFQILLIFWESSLYFFNFFWLRLIWPFLLQFF